jgi:hypothetical protein
MPGLSGIRRRKILKRYLRWFIAREARVNYVPLYNLHRRSTGQFRFHTPSFAGDA